MLLLTNFNQFLCNPYQSEILYLLLQVTKHMINVVCHDSCLFLCPFFFYFLQRKRKRVKRVNEREKHKKADLIDFH